MKIAGLQKNSMIDFPGRLSAVVFTQGCNMNCGYCHNRRLIGQNQGNGLIPEEEVLAFLKRRTGLLDGVVVSGGEPTIQKDLFLFFEKIRAMGFKTKLDTNGTDPVMLKRLIDSNLLDYVAMDVKAPLCNYRKVCCCSVDTGLLSESIDLLRGGKVEYEFRTTYTPELCDEDLLDITQTIKGAKRYVLQQYREVDQEEGTYTGTVEKRNILNNITAELRKSVVALQFRGEFGMM